MPPLQGRGSRPHDHAPSPGGATFAPPSHPAFVEISQFGRLDAVRHTLDSQLWSRAGTVFFSTQAYCAGAWVAALVRLPGILSTGPGLWGPWRA